eukprot:CAMPEP_0184645472 /NCGR_PEP_ID=MMETSP0308-20130426/1960_1 /TAXON_ID=38269 /ORGANISM="Gloeochaete witrockiana, Strain SAG 46.84" /LENGTH=431 /DNA_ID=CAMNT_0027074511 /DNA_START=202 /DNA_END=1496 /DNA_ORIENTATION=+
MNHSDVTVDVYGFLQTPEAREAEKRYLDSIARQKRRWGRFVFSIPPDAVKTYDPNELRTRASELRRIVRLGVPSEIRLKVWLASAQRLRRKREGYFDGLVYTSAGVVKTRELDAFSSQIEKDLLRTFPNNRSFQNRIPLLQRTLLAYALHNPRVGYCQGLNFIVGHILLVNDSVNEEQAFWLLATLVERVLPSNFFTPGMLDLLAYQHVAVQLVHERLPALSAHLDALGVPLTNIFTKWFVALFVTSLPPETALRIWDAMFLEGSEVLVRVVLGILKLCEEMLLKQSDGFDALAALNDAVSVMYDPDRLLEISLSRFTEFPPGHIDNLLGDFRREWQKSKGEPLLFTIDDKDTGVEDDIETLLRFYAGFRMFVPPRMPARNLVPISVALRDMRSDVPAYSEHEDIIEPFSPPKYPRSSTAASLVTPILTPE